MARITNAVIAKQNRDADIERQLRGMKGLSFVPVPFRWQTSQTHLTVTFRGWGTFPRTHVAWKRGDLLLPWSLGREDDQFMMEAGFATRLGLIQGQQEA